MSAIATATPTPIPAGTWMVDPAHSSAGFAVKHLGIATVRGYFDGFDGTLAVADDLSRSTIIATIDATSINTNEEQRDTHLRSPDFFDAETHPTLVFESTAIAPVDGETFRITGKLTMRGVTRPVELEAIVEGTETDPWGNERVGLQIAGRLNRSEFGMTFNQALGGGNVLVSDKVKLSLDISALKAA